MAGDIAANLPVPLESFRIVRLPAEAYYIPHFITADEERLLLSKISAAPTTAWTQLRHRRLQTYPSKLSRHNVLNTGALPSWLYYPVIPRLGNLLLAIDTNADVPAHVFASSPHQRPNHVLVNEYQPGQGIMPHEDGAAYWPVVATVSAGAPIVLDIYGKDECGRQEGQPQYRILQEARSLLILTNDVFTDHLHGIAEQTVDENLTPDAIANWTLLGEPEMFANGDSVRRTRTSLTFRDVLQVSDKETRLSRFCKR